MELSDREKLRIKQLEEEFKQDDKLWKQVKKVHKKDKDYLKKLEELKEELG